MAMATVGISINLNELKSMGYKPFVVGLIAAITVDIVSIISLETFLKLFLKMILKWFNLRKKTD